MMLGGCRLPSLPNFAVICNYIPLIGIPANVDKEGSLIEYAARRHMMDVQARANFILLLVSYLYGTIFFHYRENDSHNSWYQNICIVLMVVLAKYMIPGDHFTKEVCIRK